MKSRIPLLHRLGPQAPNASGASGGVTADVTIRARALSGSSIRARYPVNVVSLYFAVQGAPGELVLPMYARAIRPLPSRSIAGPHASRISGGDTRSGLPNVFPPSRETAR